MAVDAQAGAAGGQVGAQDEVVVVVAAVLGPVRDGRGGGQGAQALVEGGGVRGVVGGGGAVGAGDDQGRQDVHAGVEEGAVQQGEQHVLGGAVDAAGAQAGGAGAGGGDDQGAAPGQVAVAVAQGAAAVVGDAEREALDEDAVRPALEDRGHPVPPQGELHDQRVRPGDLVLFGADVGRQGAGGVGALRLGADDEAGGGVVAEVFGPDDRVPAHRVQVGVADVVAVAAQGGGAVVAQGAVEERPSGWAKIHRTFMACLLSVDSMLPGVRRARKWPVGQCVQGSGHGR